MNTSKVLAGKVAVITGAGRGIGRAIALGYARAGAAIGCAARTTAEIDHLAEQIGAEGGSAVAVATDVSRRESVLHLFDQVASSLGGIDIVILNAGVNLDRQPVEASDPDFWETTLRVNLLGAYFCAQAAIPHLKRRGGGKIITIGSGLGHRGSPGSSAYSCSKAGLWMLTRVLALELRPFHISVNELIPGPVRTTLDQHHEGKTSLIPQLEQEWVKQPEEVVPLALFLATQPDDGPTAQSFSLMRRDG
jgi:3-oxoacyl-[acyl-carrier protein] reductase